MPQVMSLKIKRCVLKHVVPREQISNTAEVLKKIKEIATNVDLVKRDQLHLKINFFLFILYLPLIVNIDMVRTVTTIQHLVMTTF